MFSVDAEHQQDLCIFSKYFDLFMGISEKHIVAEINKNERESGQVSKFLPKHFHCALMHLPLALPKLVFGRSFRMSELC